MAARIWTQYIKVHFGAEWNEEGQGEEGVVKMTPQFLLALLVAQQCCSQNWGALERN